MRGMAAYYKAELKNLMDEGKVREFPEADLKVCAEPHPTRTEYHHVRMWSGKQSKPYYNYLVRNEDVEKKIEDHISRGKSHIAYKKREAESRKKADAEARKGYPVGTILHGSWGYDQTNCELYEVVERPSPSIAVIRPLKTESVDTEGISSMSTYLKPIPGEYVGPPTRNTITRYGVKLNRHCSLTPTSPESKHYSSWYA